MSPHHIETYKPKRQYTMEDLRKAIRAQMARVQEESRLNRPAHPRHPSGAE